MKHFIIMTAAFFTVAVSAQDFQGVAVYQSKTKMTITTSADGPPMDEAFKEQLARLTEKSFTLVFNRTESLYEEEAKLESPSLSLGGMNINFGDGPLYKNLKDKTFSREMDMMGKEFLVQDSLQKRDWILVNETKQIGDYTCYKATCTIVPEQPPVKAEGDEKETGLLDLLPEPKDIVITAWYTPQIPISHGPGDFWGLPGLILEVNNGGTTILCSKITLNPKEKVEIKKPKKGEKVTSAELNDIMMKKLEEMNEMNRPAGNGNGNVRTTTIRIGG